MKEIPLQPESQQSGLNLGDILFILFKHKWKIIVSTVVGQIAAASVYFLWAPVYVSEAKLLVRYVVDTSGVDPEAAAGVARREADSIMNSEVEILTSWDLAFQVAERLGPQRLSPRVGGTVRVDDAAPSISRGLTVLSTKGSNVIRISYKSEDPQLAVAVLDELIQCYFKKHLEIHRNTESFNAVYEENLKLQANLGRTEGLLKKKKAEANVISLADSIASITAEMARTREQLNAAEAELAERRAAVRQFEGALSASGGSKAGVNEGNAKEKETVLPQADKGDVLKYQALVKNLGLLRDQQVTLLSKYAEDSQVVKLNRAQIEDLERQRRDLETKIPNLPDKAQDNGSMQSPRSDYSTERARLAGVEARTEALRARLQDVQARAAQLSALAPEIDELQRQKELEESTYKAAQASLERARTTERLDPSRMPNISMVQKPAPAMRDLKKTQKIILGLGGGGVAFGIGWALLIGLLLDRSVKRPLELESLGIPLMISIPKLNGISGLYLDGRESSDTAERKRKRAVFGELVPWGAGSFIQPFAAAIRDRLVLYFDRKKVIHNPKLVAVTGCSGGEGASTIAAGLAAALTETGDGKVLLVDMNVGREEAHALLEGRQTCSLDDVIEGGDSIPRTPDNLYVMKAPPSGAASQIIPKQFYDLVPRFKATDFDYIIFDMPPIAQSTVALAMSGFMDKVLLVVEAEQTNRDVVKRAHAELIASQADVSAVVNKTTSYTPKWFRDEEPGSIALPCPRPRKQRAAARKPLAVVRSVFWVALFFASTLCFIVIFGQGVSNFGENAKKEFESLKVVFGLAPKKAAPAASETTVTKKELP